MSGAGKHETGAAGSSRDEVAGFRFPATGSLAFLPGAGVSSPTAGAAANAVPAFFGGSFEAAAGLADALEGRIFSLHGPRGDLPGRLALALDAGEFAALSDALRVRFGVA